VISKQAASLLLTLRYHARHAAEEQEKAAKLAVPSVGPVDVHVERIAGASALDAETAVSTWQKAKAAARKQETAVSAQQLLRLHDAPPDPASVLLQGSARLHLRGSASGETSDEMRVNRHRAGNLHHTPSEAASVLDDAGSAALANVAAGVSAEHILASLLEHHEVLGSGAVGRGTSDMRFRAGRDGGSLSSGEAVAEAGRAIQVVSSAEAEAELAGSSSGNKGGSIGSGSVVHF